MVHPWVSEWVSECLLVYSLPKQSKSLLTNTWDKEWCPKAASLCVLGITGDERIMKCVVPTCISLLGKLIVKSWSPPQKKKEWDFSIIKLKRVRTHLIQKDPMNGSNKDLSKNHGWTDSLQSRESPTQINLNLSFCSIIYTMDKFYPLSCNKPPWLMILNSDPLPGFLEREKREHNQCWNFFTNFFFFWSEIRNLMKYLRIYHLSKCNPQN